MGKRFSTYLYPAAEKLLRKAQSTQMSRAATLELIPPPSERKGGLGTMPYSEWCYSVGFFQSLIYQVLPAERPLRVLDVGCGVGRLYLATKPYLQAGDSYTGMDVGKNFIEICRSRYVDSRVNFVHFDASNPMYAKDQTVEMRPWPFADGQFNFITALSVWTHLNENDFEFYLRELGRTLSPGGVAMVSFFILDDAYSDSLPTRSGARSEFYPQPSNMWIFDQSAYGSDDYYYPKWAEVPEEAIGVNKTAFDKAVSEAGLKVSRYYSGSWKERPGLHFQDIVVFERA